MKFYDCQTAPSPRRVRMFIAEKSIEVTTVEVNLREREQLEPAFLRVNPNATVPVLTLDDGTCLCTTAGCRAFLEAHTPNPSLLGDSPVAKGLIADRIWRIEMDGLMAVGECLRNTAKGMKDRALAGPHNYAQIPGLAERGRLRADRFFSVLDSWLAESPFVAGEDFSAADIDAFVFVEFAKWIKLQIPDICVNVERWSTQIAQRPSAAL